MAERSTPKGPEHLRPIEVRRSKARCARPFTAKRDDELPKRKDKIEVSYLSDDEQRAEWDDLVHPTSSNRSRLTDDEQREEWKNLTYSPSSVIANLLGLRARFQEYVRKQPQKRAYWQSQIAVVDRQIRVLS